MTKLLEKAYEAVRKLPTRSQDEIATAMLNFVQSHDEPEDIEQEHLEAVLRGLSEMERQEFATDEEVEAAYRKFEP